MLVNLAIDDTTPLWGLCPYDALALDRDVIQEVRASHPFDRAAQHRPRPGDSNGIVNFAREFTPDDLAVASDRMRAPRLAELVNDGESPPAVSLRGGHGASWRQGAARIGDLDADRLVAYFDVEGERRVGVDDRVGAEFAHDQRRYLLCGGRHARGAKHVDREGTRRPRRIRVGLEVAVPFIRHDIRTVPMNGGE